LLASESQQAIALPMPDSAPAAASDSLEVPPAMFQKQSGLFQPHRAFAMPQSGGNRHGPQ
jgi:hypothetical protein